MLDLFIALFVVLIVLRGARTGFLAGAFSLAGMVLGAALGSRIAPSLLPENESQIYNAGITLASIVAFAVLGDVLARMIGGSLRSRLRGAASEALDGLGGALLSLAFSLTMVWVIGTFILQSPPLSPLQPSVKDSRILQALDERMPSGVLTRAVANFDPLPQVQGPEPKAGKPDKSILDDPDIQATRSRVVRVTGIACGYGIEGSGWVAAPDLIVTNAHVVAGEVFTKVQSEGTGPGKRARVVFFDAKNDIAILRVNDLGLPSLPLTSPKMGQDVAVLGFPGNGPLDVRAGRAGITRPVVSSDAYNQGPVERTVTTFRVYVRPGNSGGPAVNSSGEVVATIFASRTDSNMSAYGIPSQIVKQRLERAAKRTRPASTGSCAN